MFAIPNTLLVHAHASDHPRLEESQMARVRIAAKERDLAGRTASIRLRRTIDPCGVWTHALADWHLKPAL